MSHPFIKVDATVEPITRAEAKAQLNIPNSNTIHDTYIDSLIPGVRLMIEGELDYIFTEKTFTWYLKQFPPAEFRVPVHPLMSITHIKYWDTETPSAQITLTEGKDDDYQVDTADWPGFIHLGIDKSWPSVRAGQVNPIEIEFHAGEQTAANVALLNEHSLHLFKLLFTHFFDNRQPVTVGLGFSGPIKFPEVVDRFMNDFRADWFGTSETDD